MPKASTTARRSTRKATRQPATQAASLSLRGPLCVDFDGVVHSYTTPYMGPTVIPDPPVPGAFAFLRALLQEGWHVYIFTTRCHEGGSRAIDAMREWFWTFEAPDLAQRLDFTGQKLAAAIYLDDRAVRFEGAFPTLDEVEALATPWNKSPRPGQRKSRPLDAWAAEVALLLAEIERGDVHGEGRQGPCPCCGMDGAHDINCLLDDLLTRAPVRVAGAIKAARWPRRAAT